MPLPATSRRSASVKPRVANLLLEYVEKYANEIEPKT